MNSKQCYLKQACRLNELINSDFIELKGLRSLSTSITSDISQEKVKSSKENDKISSVVSKIIDLETEINEEISQFIDLKKEIRDVIALVLDRNQQLVLRLRYIEFLSWEQVAERMTYSLKQVFRIHREAIKNITIPER